MKAKAFIQLFGPVSITRQHHTHILTGSIAKLITLLALQEKTEFSFPRGRVAGYLWPDNTEEKARHLLSNTLYRLKNLLGDDAPILTTSSDSIGLVDIETDVAQFKSLIASADPADWHEAFGLYHGDLAEDIDSDWILPYRAELWEKQIVGLEQASRLLWESAEYETGHLVAKKWVMHDPINEEGYYYLMRFLVKIGRQTAALQQYQKIEQILEEELSITPLPHLQKYYANLMAERATVLNPPKIQRELFVGRQAERQQLLNYLNALDKGDGAVVLLEADAGMGKTRLIDELQNYARLRHFQVAYGKGEQTGASELFAPLSTALRSCYRPEWMASPKFPSFSKRLLEPFLTETRAPHDDVLPPNLNFSVPFDTALRHLLESVTQNAPLLLCLDDLHWGEASLWQLLKTVCEVTRHRPLLVVLSYRPIELSEDLIGQNTINGLEAEFLPDRMILPGLKLDEILQLASELESLLTPNKVEEIHRLSRGNPFVAKEFLLNKGEPSDSLSELLESRYQALSEPARQNLKAAVVLGNSFKYDVWQECAGGQIELQELISGRFVVQNDEISGYSFYHDFVRSMLYHQMSDQERIEHHLVATNVLIRAKATAEQIAWHCEAAKQLPEAVYYHQKAAEINLGVHAYKNARRHIQLAQQLGSQTALSEEARLRLLLTEQRITQTYKQSADRLDELESLEQLALNLEDGSALLQIAQLKLLMTTAAGDATKIKEVAIRLVQIAEDHGDARELAESLLLAADTHVNVLMESKEGLSLVDRSLPVISNLAHNQQLLAAAKLIEANGYLRFREIEKAKTALGQAKRAIDTNQNLEPMTVRFKYLTTVVDQLEGRMVDAFRQYKALIPIYKMLDDLKGVITMLHNVGHTGMLLGQHEESIAASEELLHIANQQADQSNQRFSAIRLADSYLMGGYLDEAESILEEIVPWLESGAAGRAARRGWHTVGGLRFYQKRYNESFEAYSRLISIVEDEDELTQTPYLVYAECAKILGKDDIARSALAKVESMFDMTVRRTGSDAYRNYVFWFVQGDFDYLLACRQTQFSISNHIVDDQIRKDFIERDPVYPFFTRAWYQETRPIEIELPSTVHVGVETVEMTFDYGKHDEPLRKQLGKAGLRQERIKRLLTDAAYRRVTLSNATIAELIGVNIRTIERDMQKLKMSG